MFDTTDQIMKIHIIPLLLTTLTATLCAHPRDHLPPPASLSKNISDYTVQDILGGAFTSKITLPEGHPFKNVSKSVEDVKKIKTEWSGAKIATNVDTILTFIIHTETRDQERYASNNIYWLIHEIMDVPASDKAAAFVRVYEAQTDAVKKRKVAFMAEKLFPYLADERLLLPLKDMLDDTSVYQVHRAEGAEDIPESTRNAARNLIGRILQNKNLLSSGYPEAKYILSAADQAAIYGVDVSEATSCALLKTWLTNHWQEITNQAAIARAKQNREYRKPWFLGGYSHFR